MPRTARIAAVILLPAVLSGGAVAPAAMPPVPRPRPQTWEQNERGEWVQVTPAPATSPAEQSIPNETLDRVEQLLAGRRGEAALRRAVSWIKANPDAPDRDRGLFLLAEAYIQTGDRIRAFYHLDELMDFYPESRFYSPALEKQFSIADDFMNGRKRVVLGFIPIGAEDEAVEMMFRIQERAPGSPIAERALLRTADFYYEDSQFDLAADAYGEYLKSYPRSPEVPRVRLFRAFASLAQFRGLRFDATPLIDARTQLEDVLAQYPQLAQQEGVREFIDRIDETLAAKVYAQADFYRRTGESRGAVYLWRYLVTNYPGSQEAERAQRHLAKAPASALEAPVPGEGRPELGGTGEVELLPTTGPRESPVPVDPQP